MKKSAFLSILIILLSAPPLAAQDCECGDVDCDGSWSNGDAVYLLHYLFGGGPPPPVEPMDWANWDDHEILTISDAWHILKFIFGEHSTPICPPPYGPLEPVVDSSVVLYYTDWIPYGASSATIALTLQDDLAPGFFGFSLPLRIRVDGGIPTIDSLIVHYEYFTDYNVYPDSGYVAIGAVPMFANTSGFPGLIAHIFLTVPPEPWERAVTMEWVRLTPIQAPTDDRTVIPMIYHHAGDELPAVEPILTPHCCVTPGDANMDGTVNIADAVFNLQCIFVDCWGHPCDKHLDANCDGTWNVVDIVHLINYIFKGGPPPCCL